MHEMNAREYAVEAHAGQTYGGEPYAVHLEAVVELVRAVDPSPEAEAVAWLHDVVEDTEAAPADLAEAFGALVAISVQLVTDPEGLPNRGARKAELHRRLVNLHPEVSRPARLALLVKAADRLANARACVAAGDSRLSMYRREHRAFRQAAHRPGLCDDLWAEMDRLLGE